MNFSATVVLCKVSGFETLEKEFNPEIATNVAKSLQMAGLRSGHLKGGHGYISANGKMTFIKMHAEQECFQQREDELAAKLKDSIHKFLHGTAFAAITDFYIRHHHPSFVKANIGEAIQRKLQSLVLETRTHVKIEERQFSFQQAQCFCEEKLLEWK